MHFNRYRYEMQDHVWQNLMRQWKSYCIEINNVIVIGKLVRNKHRGDQVPSKSLIRFYFLSRRSNLNVMLCSSMYRTLQWSFSLHRLYSTISNETKSWTIVIRAMTIQFLSVIQVESWQYRCAICQHPDQHGYNTCLSCHTRIILVNIRMIVYVRKSRRS
jgi:hypothetical protein